jgi:sigma-E factor negative regulatory protein RseB
MRSCTNNLKTVFTASFLCILSTSSFADDLFDMLKRMSEADTNQNYQGTFILRKSDNLSTLKVTHGVDDKGEWESLEALDGEPRKVFRHNNLVVSVYPSRELVTVRHNSKESSLYHQLPENIDQLAQFYIMERLADDRIANQPTLVIDLMPMDKYRYGYRYWIDKSTGMLLRCDLIDEDKKVVEQMMFTSLDYLEEAPDQVFDLQNFKQYQQQNLDEGKVDASELAGIDGWRVGQLPKGFMLTQSAMRYSKPPQKPENNTAEIKPQEETKPDLLHLVYSDGLASVSVFIESNRGEGQHMQGEASMGAVNAYGNALDGYFATVVGEVPAKTVQMIAKSMMKVAQ